MNLTSCNYITIIKFKVKNKKLRYKFINREDLKPSQEKYKIKMEYDDNDRISVFKIMENSYDSVVIAPLLQLFL